MFTGNWRLSEQLRVPPTTKMQVKKKYREGVGHIREESLRLIVLCSYLPQSAHTWLKTTSYSNYKHTATIVYHSDLFSFCFIAAVA